MTAVATRHTATSSHRCFAGVMRRFLRRFSSNGISATSGSSASGVYLANTISPKLTASTTALPRDSAPPKQKAINSQVSPSSSPSALQDAAVNSAMGEMASAIMMGKNRFITRSAK